MRSAGGIAGSGFWRPGDRHPCWVCHKSTKWAYLDMAYQHPDCDMYPTEYGNVKIVRAEIVHCDHNWTTVDTEIVKGTYCTECGKIK